MNLAPTSSGKVDLSLVFHSLIAAWMLLLSGCASSELTLSVDLYQEDPVVVKPLTTEELAQSLKNLDRITADAHQLAADRKRVARESYELNKAILDLGTKAKLALRPQDEQETTRNAQADQAVESAAKKYLEDYGRILDRKVEELDRLAASAREAINSYSRWLVAGSVVRDQQAEHAESEAARREHEPPQSLPSQAEVANRIATAVSAAAELTGDLHTDFEKWLPQQWVVVTNSVQEASLRAWLTPETLSKVQTQFDDMRAKAQKLSQTFDELAKRGRVIDGRAREMLQDASSRAQATDLGRMQASIQEIVAAATKVPMSLSWGDGGGAALGELLAAANLYATQLDRLQDPANPAWRVLADPLNQDKWREEFSKTYFYAQGNSSVVVVRDTPISFRVQDSRNNPVALVKGQLQISRAVAGAAITIAGAAAGIPIPGAAGGGAPPSSGTPAPSAEPDELARRKATIEQEAMVRRQASLSLQRTLTDLRQELTSLPPPAQPPNDVVEARRRALLEQLQSSLSAYLEVFPATDAGGGTPP